MVRRDDRRLDRSDRAVPEERPEVPASGPPAVSERTLGELSANVAHLLEQVKKQGDHIDTFRHQVTFVRGAMWVIGPVLLVLVGAVSWIIHAVVTGSLTVTVINPK